MNLRLIRDDVYIDELSKNLWIIDLYRNSLKDVSNSLAIVS